ncbi:hypothetical protein [Sciscionella sediminilitoris]|uniref:hypothetical protein n=1 Tax=Sciscionella sediminilitoris TaxID=1445613 RepID=UPI0004DF8241|nr:hypothetical protein [Sciscionella sp. SE31]
MTGLHETARRLRVLLAHLARHPDLPEVSRAGTTHNPDLEIAVDGDTTAEFLSWCATFDHPKVRVGTYQSRGAVLLWGHGFIRGDAVRISAHVTDLPELGEWPEPMPLIGFRHVLTNSGWRS